jgi:SAM-dependent methyltransferase
MCGMLDCVGENVFLVAPRVGLSWNDASSMHTNYRESHVGKGREYHEKFVRGPYRSVIWEVEQAALLAILSRYQSAGSGPIRLLDFACGTGRILQLFESRVETSVGVDVSKSMLEVAESHLSRSELLNVDLTRETALSGRRFELITAFRFFPNAEPQLRDDVMRELVGLLADNGVMVFNNHLRCTGSRMRLRRFLRRAIGRGSDRDLHCMSDAEVDSLAGRFGLCVVELHSLAVLPVLKEKRPRIPKRLIEWIERWAVDRKSLAAVANTRIYVLRRDRSNGARQAESSLQQ